MEFIHPWSVEIYFWNFKYFRKDVKHHVWLVHTERWLKTFMHISGPSTRFKVHRISCKAYCRGCWWRKNCCGEEYSSRESGREVLYQLAGINLIGSLITQGMKSSFGYTSPRISRNPPPKCFHFFEIIYFFLGTGSHKMADIRKLIDAKQHGSFYISGKLPTYPSRKPTLTLSSYLEQNVGFGEG